MFTIPTNWSSTKAGTTGTDPIWQSTAAFFGTGTLTLNWDEPTRLEGTDVTVTDDGSTITIDDGVNEHDINRPVEIVISPASFSLEADYLGNIAASRVVTISLSQGSSIYTYDDATPYANNTFRIHNITDGDASVTNNSDGTLTVTDIEADSQTVTFDISYVDNSGAAVSINQSFDVLRMTVPRIFPGVIVTPNTFTLNANYRGQVTPVTETITVSVAEGTTNFTYDATDAGTASTFFITSVTDGASSITNNLDGTLTLTDIADDADSAVAVVNIRYYDTVGVCLLYTSPSPRDS